MNKRRPAAAILALMLAAGIALSGCGGSKPAENKPAEEKPAVKEEPLNNEQIEFWFAIGGKGQEMIKSLAEKFNNSQTEVKVTPVYQGDYYANHQKMSTAIAAGSVPALSMVEVASLAFFSENGALADLNTLIADKDYIADFHEGLMKEANYKGKLTSIPFNRSTPILYINSTILKEAGLDPKGPKNWDELRDWAKKLTVVKDGKVERWGFLTPVDIWFYEAMVLQAGGTILSNDGKKATFNDAAGQAALQYWVDLIHTDKVMEMPQGEKYNAWDVTTNALTSGKAAMIYSTTGRLNSHIKGGKDKGFEINTAFLPAGKAGYATPTGGANLVVMAKASRNQQRAAVKFIQFLTNPENAAEFSKATGYIPVTKKAVASMADFLKATPQYQVAIDQLKYAQPRPQHPAYSEMQEAIMKALQVAVLKEKPVNTALDEAAALVTKNLK